jgi:hypothetical protein
VGSLKLIALQSAKNILYVRSALFWDFTQSRMVVCYRSLDVSAQPVFPIFKGQAVFLDFLTFEDGADKLSRNVGKKLAFYAA